MLAPSKLTRLNEIFWREWPGKVATRSAAWGSLLADGAQLSAWPVLGGLAPPLAALLGLVIGLGHLGYAPESQIVFLFSVPALLAFVSLGLQGAGVGAWLWAGFAFGDAAWAALTLPTTIAPEMMLAGRALQDLVLATGLIGLPAAVSGLSQRLAVSAPPGSAIEGLSRGVLAFFLVWLWLLASAVQLQAVYTFAGMTPPTEALVASLTANGWSVALAAAVSAAARGLAEKAAMRMPDHAAWVASLRRDIGQARDGGLARSAAAIVAKAVLTTFALAAFIANGDEALILFGGIALILAVRTYGLGAFGLGRQIAALAPFRLRLAAAVVVVVAIGGFLLDRNRVAANGFTPALEAVLISLLVYALLLPEGLGRVTLRSPKGKAA